MTTITENYLPLRPLSPPLFSRPLSEMQNIIEKTNAIANGFGIKHNVFFSVPFEVENVFHNDLGASDLAKPEQESIYTFLNPPSPPLSLEEQFKHAKAIFIRARNSNNIKPSFLSDFITLCGKLRKWSDFFTAYDVACEKGVATEAVYDATLETLFRAGNYTKFFQIARDAKVNHKCTPKSCALYIRAVGLTPSARAAVSAQKTLACAERKNLATLEVYESYIITVLECGKPEEACRGFSEVERKGILTTAVYERLMHYFLNSGWESLAIDIFYSRTHSLPLNLIRGNSFHFSLDGLCISDMAMSVDYAFNSNRSPLELVTTLKEAPKEKNLSLEQLKEQVINMVERLSPNTFRFYIGGATSNHFVTFVHQQREASLSQANDRMFQAAATKNASFLR